MTLSVTERTKHHGTRQLPPPLRSQCSTIVCALSVEPTGFPVSSTGRRLTGDRWEGMKEEGRRSDYSLINDSVGRTQASTHTQTTNRLVGGCATTQMYRQHEPDECLHLHKLMHVNTHTHTEEHMQSHTDACEAPRTPTHRLMKRPVLSCPL